MFKQLSEKPEKCCENYRLTPVTHSRYTTTKKTLNKIMSKTLILTHEKEEEEDRQCIYNGTLRRVCLTIVAVEKQ